MCETKICTKCKVKKPLTSFFKRGEKNRKYVYRSACKECCKLQGRKNINENKEAYAKTQKNYKINNRDKINKTKQKWRKNNPDKEEKTNKKQNKKIKEKYNTDPIYRAKINEAHKRNRNNNLEQYKTKAREQYHIHNKENRKRRKIYYEKHKIKINIKSSIKQKQAVIDLPDYYVKTKIRQLTGLTNEEISQELIEMKRITMILKREIKNAESPVLN